ncbi:MAG: SusC/RagA family TonB-linked outer membrane protein, partial [Sphingobacteriaceae bacterium]
MNLKLKTTHVDGKPLPKILLVMKLTAVLVFAILNNVSANIYSQVVTLHEKKASVQKILKSIEKQTGYHFLYDKQDVTQTGGIDIEAVNQPVETVLDRCFQDQQLTYKIFETTIVVKKKEVVKTAQAVTIQGTVTDAKGPLPGVTVRLKNTDLATVTNAAGKYSLSAPNNTGTLVFSFVGYNTQEIAINNRTVINVVLAETPKSLSEVVVVGYGTQRRSDLTGSVGSVSSRQLQERPQTNLEQELAGKIPGVNVTTNSGEPGGDTRIRIRGYSSINTNTDPLYVVDGIVWTSGGNAINPNDIATIDVLKDASSTAIYGTRGANGVILITTKRGSKNRPSTVSYDSYVSMSHMAKELPVLNAQQFLAVEDQSYANIQKYDPVGWAAGNYATKDPRVIRTALIGRLFDANLNPLYDVDWQKATTRTAYSQNHNLSFTGGSENINYGLFLNYADDEGIILNSYLKRYNARLTLDNTLKPWLKVGATLNYNSQQQRLGSYGTGGNNIPRMLIEMIPIVPITYPDGTYGKRTDYPNTEGGDNPVAQAREIQQLAQLRLFSGNGYANINILKGLEFRSVIGVTTAANYYPSSQSGLVGGSTINQSYSSASLNENNNTFWQWQNYFTYSNTFNKIHSLNVVVGTERQNYQQLSFGTSTRNLSDNFYQFYNLGAGSIPGLPSSNYTAWQMQSFYGRVNYGYRDKYLLTVTGRTDGSSRFGTNVKYGFFPSAALAWRVSQEDFLKDNKTISDLKLRFSYGVTGNSEIGQYQSLANISTSRNGGVNNYVFGGTQASATT